MAQRRGLRLVLKPRVIVTLTLNEGVLFRTKLFRPDYRYTLNFVDLEAVDELVVLDVSRTPDYRKAYYETIERVLDAYFGPLALGGWVRSVEDAKFLMRNFACDKVVVNTWAQEPGSIEALAHKIGSQSVTISVDSRDGYVWVDRGRSRKNRTSDWLREIVARGAGEVFLMDMDRDGSLQGYNLDLLKQARELNVPVVAAGGCGSWKHMKEAFELGCTGASTAVIHHFTKPSLIGCKKWLEQNGVPVRI